MNLIDWVTILLAVSLALTGARAGLVAGGLLVGAFAGGALLGGRVASGLLNDGNGSAYAPLAVLIGGIGSGAIAALLVDRVASRARGAIMRNPLGAGADSAGGAVLFALLGISFAWALGAVALHTPGLDDLRRDVQRSKILTAVYDVVPPRGELVGLLRSIDQLASLRAPDAEIEPPPRGIATAAGVRTASASVVRVTGTACGLGVAGSGWVAAPDLVVTNAHVVAGQDDTTVVTGDGTEHDAVAVAYQPLNDLAVLRVGGLASAGTAPLVLADRSAGEPGAILGYPHNGPFKAAPARVGPTETVRSTDSYGRGPVEREMTVLRGMVVDGNSGGPVVDAQGRVMTTVFASAIGSGPPRGLGVPNRVTSELLSAAGDEVSTGPCAR